MTTSLYNLRPNVVGNGEETLDIFHGPWLTWHASNKAVQVENLTYKEC